MIFVFEAITKDRDETDGSDSSPAELRLHVRNVLAPCALASMLALTASLFGCATPLPEAFSTYRLTRPGQPAPAFEYLDRRAARRAADASDRLVVWTLPRDDAAANDAITLLEACGRSLERRLGVEPPPFGLFLATGRDPDRPAHLAIGREPDELVFPLPVTGGPLRPSERFAIVRMMTHEWVEQSLARAYLVPIGLYDRDPYARWVGDGLAELLSVRLTEELLGAAAAAHATESRAAELEAALESDLEAIRLQGWKARVISGEEVVRPSDDRAAEATEAAHYAAALALWLRVDAAGGHGIVAAFLREIVEVPSDELDGEQCARRLRRLSGVDVPVLVASFPTGDALESLRAEAAALRER
jgi:hypothetical protein